MFVLNIRAERFLPTRPMIRILQRLHRARGLSVPGLKREYEEECHRHSLQGGRVRSNPLPVSLGRAVERDMFVDWLCTKEAPIRFTTRLEAERFVKRQLEKVSLSDWESTLMMSRFGAWVTWSTHPPRQDPFHFVVHGAPQEVRSCLGLQDLSGPLLLLVYQLPQGTALRRPTIADGAGFPQYQPPGFVTDHGLTRPWSELCSIIPIPKYQPLPRPEGIHGPVPMASLRALRQLK